MEYFMRTAQNTELNLELYIMQTMEKLGKTGKTAHPQQLYPNIIVY